MSTIPTDDKLEDAPELRIANEKIAHILGANLHLYEAEWTRLPARKPAYRLTLRQEGDEVSTTFTLDELENRQFLQVRISRLWGQLLQGLIEQQHQILQGLIEQQRQAVKPMTGQMAGGAHEGE